MYINAFGLTDGQLREDIFGNWKTSPVIICDGGTKFWGALFDVESKQFSDLKFNGKL